MRTVGGLSFCSWSYSGIYRRWGFAKYGHPIIILLASETQNQRSRNAWFKEFIYYQEIQALETA